MKIFRLPLILIFLTMATLTFAQNKASTLIDREIFFGNPEIAAAQLSPDGKWISFLKEYKGTLNIWVKKFDEPFDKARPLTANERPLGGYFWTNDGKYLLFVKDNKGDENFHIYAVDPTAPSVAETGIPQNRDLTPREKITAQIYKVSRKNPNILWIGLNDRDQAWHDLYKLDISTGELTKLFENHDRLTGWEFDWNENARLAYRTAENGFSQILKVEGDNKFTKIYETNLQETAGVQGWNEDNSKFYLESNKGDVNFSTLYLMDPVSLKIEKFESDPKNKVDFGSIFLDENTHKIINTSYTYDKRVRYWKDKNWEAMFKKLQAKLPNKEVGFASFTNDYKKMLVVTTGDKYASDTYFYDNTTGQLIHQFTPQPKLKKVESLLAAMQPISYKSSDGLEIPAYLTLPNGKGNKNLPLVVLVHGGPKGPRDTWGFNAYVQMLANRGYAVLLPNFRASGGYGKAFLNAGDREWGRKMQDDVTWGVKYLINQGIADPKKVAIMGGSYGGYATLAGLTFTPDLYNCGVDIVGPSNLFTLLESVPAYWESFRKSLYEMTGDPNTEEGKKLIKERSPIFHVDNINKPLMIIQGANDPRVKQAESDQIVEALYKKGKYVEYMLADDEGHGFRKPVNNMAMWAGIERFLAKQLGGQYQESMPENVAKRYKEITLDVSKVKYVPKTEVKVSAVPTLKGDITEGEYDYNMLIKVQGQEIPMTSKRIVKKVGDTYVITESAKSPMGEATDISIINAANLVPLSREMTQMGQKINLTHAGNKLKADVAGKVSEKDTKDGFWFESAGFDLLIAKLPLKAGYTLNFDAFDVMSQKIITKKLTVESLENNIAKVKVINVDNEKDATEYTIDTIKGMATSSSQTVPMMGNAVITTTLK